MSAYKHAALRIDDFRAHLGWLEHVRLNDPARYEADGLASNRLECERALRLWVLSVRAALDEMLAALPEPAAPQAPPEKSAGHISESVHG